MIKYIDEDQFDVDLPYYYIACSNEVIIRANTLLSVMLLWANRWETGLKCEPLQVGRIQ